MLWNCFKQKCIESIDTFVPSKMTSTRFSQAWCNRDIRCLSKRKKRAFKKARATKKQSDWHRYKKSRKKPSKHVEEPTVTTSASEPGSNNKKLFAYIKDMKCNSSGVAPLKKDGINYSEPTDQVEILNEQFVSAFTKEDCTSIPTMGNSTVNSAPPLKIQANGVKKLLLSQIPHKSSGPD